MCKKNILNVVIDKGMSTTMVQGSRFVCWSSIEIRRLLWIFGLAFGLVLILIRFLNLRDGNAFSSTGNLAEFSNTADSIKSSNHTIVARNKDDFRGKNVGVNEYGFVRSSSSDSPSLSNGIPKNATSTVSIPQMNELLLQSHSIRNRKMPRMLSVSDEELLRAKSEIENTPLSYNSGLYVPLYRNASKFKTSYELMEKMLRVYIYKEGEKPIFHESDVLEGIYASEGWFLKLLESNKKFVTTDSTKAHLFYIPFSSRQLELTLYVPHSHSRNNLIDFMKNYVELLIQKHPFWNRTNGEDHFLAACHDWAPAETRGRMLNCIRVLCNADIRTGFVLGKDVSLPTVNVRSAKNPLNDIGGEPISKRPILAFFAGYMHGNVRPTLLKHWGNDPDMRILGRIPHVKGDKNYTTYMKSSKYCICARGYAVHSPRVVESILFDCVPVIISDNYVPPFFEILKWESFAVFVLEREIPDLKKILMSIPEEKYFELQKGVKEVQRHFLWHIEPVEYDLFHMILHSTWYNRIFRI